MRRPHRFAMVRIAIFQGALVSAVSAAGTGKDFAHWKSPLWISGHDIYVSHWTGEAWEEQRTEFPYLLRVELAPGGAVDDGWLTSF